MRGREQVWILVFLLASAWPAAGVAAPTTAAVIAQVQTALDRGDAKAAAALAEGGLKERDISPLERARLQLYHGLAEELLGANEAATRDLTAAISTGALPAGERAQALLQRGFLHDGQGELAAAEADYSEVVKMGGEGLANALNNRANVYRRQNRFTAARRDYQAALAAKGKAQYSWYGLGQIAEAEGDVLSARGFYAKAVATDQAYAPAVQRLNALGGPPEGVIANPKAPITLKPPQAGQVAAQAAPPPPEHFTQPLPGQVASAPPPADAPIVLRPPRPRSAAPTARSAPSAPSGITLRPSMDQSAGGKSATGGEVQLGAWRSEAEARAGWQKAQARARDLLAGLQPHVVAADIPGRGRYYRLRVSPGTSRSQFCDSLNAAGVTCFPARD